MQHMKGSLIATQAQLTLELQRGNAGRERGNEEHRMEPRQQVLASTVKNRSRSQAALVAVGTFNQSFAIEWPATLNSAPRTDKSVRISNPEKKFFAIGLSAKSARELT